jgi:anhydro-N-acetylmuramic acid kinase
MIENYKFNGSQWMLSIGLMSGTSMDGIDAALIRTDGQFQVEELGNIFIDYTQEFHQLLKGAEYLVRHFHGEMHQAHRTNFLKYFREYLSSVIHLSEAEIEKVVKKATLYLHQDEQASITLADIIEHSTRLHAQAVSKLLQQVALKPGGVDVIGYHGQTLYHAPGQQITIQVGDGALLANQTGIAVICDFRIQDVKMGGQGAPLAPLYHQALAVRDNIYPLVVVNCGGLANITIIKGKEFANLLAFDTGPGNGLIDLFVKQKTNFSENMDYNGQYGNSGKVHDDILEKLYKHSIQIEGRNYFEMSPPKSLDVNDLKMIPELDGIDINDGCATLEAFTADSIVKGFDFVSNFQPKRWVLAGGGGLIPL